MGAFILEESTQGLVFTPAEDGQGVILTGLGKCKNNEEITLGTYQGKRIVGIGKGALKGGRFTTITLPPTVKFIEKGAFAKCADLERVHIFDLSAWCGIRFADGEANPLYYGQRLFLRGKELDRVAIPEGVKEIGAFAFYRFAGLVRLYLPKSLERIGNAAFSGCMGLTELSLPQGLREIGADAFSGCTGIEGEFRLESLRCLGEYAFEGCKKIQTVIFYPCLEQFGKGTFLHCDSLANVHFYGARLPWEEAMKKRKKNFPSFTAVTQDDGGVEVALEGNCVSHVTEYGKTKESIMIPEGATGIGRKSFRECLTLTSLFIPKSVIGIPEKVFFGCDNLASIMVEEGNPKYHSAGNCVIETATKTLVAGCKTSVIPADGSVTGIGVGAFYGCRSLAAITIPNCITNIESGAFSICKGLTSITIPDCVTSIGEAAFSGCESLASIAVGAGNPAYRSIGNCLIATKRKALIAGCKNSVIPTDGSVTVIGKGAFSGQKGLTAVTVPAGVKCIEESAIDVCLQLTSITVPASVVEIGAWAFSSCWALKTILYQGTKAQWAAIKKGKDYLYLAPASLVIRCTDGEGTK